MTKLLEYDITLTARVQCVDYEAALQLVALGTLALSEAYNIDTVTGEVQHVCTREECDATHADVERLLRDHALVAKSTPPAILRDIMKFRDALDDHAMVWPRALYELTDEDLTIIFDFARMQQEGST